jgi:hypothetical protein
VIADRSDASLDAFFGAQHQSHALTTERVQALQLLEMQRHTPCTDVYQLRLVFDEISRPEGTQILRYAARAVELAGEVAGIELTRSLWSG